jgi:hypothetical protein
MPLLEIVEAHNDQIVAVAVAVLVEDCDWQLNVIMSSGDSLSYCVAQPKRQGLPALYLDGKSTVFNVRLVTSLSASDGHAPTAQPLCQCSLGIFPAL